MNKILDQILAYSMEIMFNDMAHIDYTSIGHIGIRWHAESSAQRRPSKVRVAEETSPVSMQCWTWILQHLCF